MALQKDTIWPIEPHTSAKHQILRKYLDAWLPILGTYNKRVVYVDGFAGPGQYTGGEPGSPIVALQAALTQLGLPLLARFFFRGVPKQCHILCIAMYIAMECLCQELSCKYLRGLALSLGPCISTRQCAILRFYFMLRN